MIFNFCAVHSLKIISKLRIIPKHKYYSLIKYIFISMPTSLKYISRKKILFYVVTLAGTMSNRTFSNVKQCTVVLDSIDITMLLSTALH